jgi:hypothetical protein
MRRIPKSGRPEKETVFPQVTNVERELKNKSRRFHASRKAENSDGDCS